MTAQGSLEVAVEAVSAAPAISSASRSISRPWWRCCAATWKPAAKPTPADGRRKRPEPAVACRPGGPQRAHDDGVQADRAGGAHRCHRADHGRIRHRQGTGGARHPRFQRAPRAAVPFRELLRPHRYTARIRAVRSHARRLHRAAAERAGLFEAADGGTLFLDELASTSPAFQASLLRVLQSGEVRRVGSTQRAA